MNKLLAVDSEGTGVFWALGDESFAWSTCDEQLKTDFWRAPVDPFTRKVNWRGQPGRWATFADRTVTKIMHNAKYDVRMAELAGHPILGRIEDTMLMASVLFSNESTGLKDLGVRWLDVSAEDEAELDAATQAARKGAEAKGWKIATKGRWGDKPWKADFWLAPSKILERYSRLDAERTMLLFHLLNPMLDEDLRLRRKYEEELELMYGVYDMESTGVRCHRHICQFERSKAKLKRKAHYSQVVKHLAKLGFKIPEKIKDPKTGKNKTVLTNNINVDSPKQIAKLVYETLGFPIKAYTAKGNAATDADALKEMEHPAIREIVSTKAADKTIEFFDKYLLHSQPTKDGFDVLHPDFYQLGARTGRFSCRNPNLQNVANALNTRSFEPIQARMPFGPRPGKIWVHADWSQIEMWIFAAESEDDNLLADLGTGNLHTETANRVFGHGTNIVDQELKDGGRSNARARAKMLNFGVVFGMGVPACMDFLKCTRAEARKNLDLYYEGYHRIRPFMEELSSRAGREGCVWNRFGRKLQVPREAAYRAVNYLVQSSAADHMKQKMRWLRKYLANRPLIGARMVLTIHDEIVIEVEESRIKPYLPEIKREFENHHGIWKNLKNLPIDLAITRERWDMKEKMEVK